MSRLEELILTQCPSGVEFKKLGQICNITTGKLNANAMTDDGKYPFFTCAKEVYQIDKYAFDTEALLVSGNGSQVGHIHYYKGKFNAYQRTYVLDNFSENISYIRHILQAFLKQRILEEVNISGVPYIKLKTLSEFLIPIPPLMVQEEIVRILDSFSGVVKELEQNLEAEQEARVKQYEYYSNEMLSFDSKSKIVEMLLGDIRSDDIDYLRLGGKEGICKVLASGVDKVINENERPVKLCNYMDVYDNSHITDAIVDDLRNGSVNDNEYERFVLREGQVLLTKDSETKEDIAQSAYVYKDYPDVVCGYHLAVLTPLVKINSKYLNYVLQSYKLRSYFSKMSYGVSRYGLRLKSIEDALVPVPPIEVQEEIVSILDRFDALVNDLKSGLPAEIALRRKQYEYYRDKLLSFEPSE